MAERGTAAAGAADPAAVDDTGVAPDAQRRNAWIYASLIALNYLTAPVLYVGFVQAALCKRLHTSDTIANLPATLFLVMAGFPVITAWLYPQARLLKTMMSSAYAIAGAMGLIVAFTLVMGAPGSVIVGALVVHAAVLGATNGITFTLNWEALGRGVSSRFRGKAFALAFGWGPGCAVIGSLWAQLLLDGKIFGWTPSLALSVPYPFNYAALFGFSVITMGTSAFVARLYKYPLPKVDLERATFGASVFGGFKSVLHDRVLLIACLAYLLVYFGNMVQINMSLFTVEAVGRKVEDLAGYQLALRFSFKMLMGFALGWVLARTNPKAPLLITVGLQIAGVLWVLMVPGYWFLLAFGINGAGELFGVYYANYPMCCSAKAHVRRNMAFLVLMSSLVGLSPVFYGWISDTWSLRASFVAALVILGGTALMVIFKLPANPRPKAEDLIESEPEPARI